MSQEREAEYAELHAFIDFIATHVSGIDPASPVHPSVVGVSIVAQFGRSKALEGLKQAVNDAVEMLSGRRPEFVERLDDSLRQHGLLTLSEVRRRYASSYGRVMKRGKINSDTEYCLVAGVLADTSSSASEAERAKLERLAQGYQGGA